jgi:Flp pilus assembly protein TadD
VALGNLGNELEHKGDLDGAIAQFQELSRLRPRQPVPHFRLGQVLEKKGEPPRAVRQFREATDLAPENREFRAAYERALHNQ